MPPYAYTAVDAGGRRHRGRLAVGSMQELRRRLSDRGLLLLAYDRDVASAPASPGRSGSLVETTRAIASLLGAGMPVTQALATAHALSQGSIADAIDAVRWRIERGESVADALAEHPHLFDPFYIGTVRAGERGSDLPGAFARLADHVERREEVRQRLISAATYPLILAAVGGIALVTLLVLVVPRFVELIADAGAEMPAATSLLLRVSGALRDGWPFLLGACAALPPSLVLLRASAGGRRVLDGALLRLPLVGSMRSEALGAHFARLLAVLLRGGAPLLAALDSVAASIADTRAGDEVARIRSLTREGQALHAALSAGDLFPELLVRFVAVGEESGRLAEFLERAATMLEDRVRRRTERLVTLLEPAMIVAFGGIVALVALSLLQAVYGLNASPL